MNNFLEKYIPKWRGWLLFSLIFGVFQSDHYGFKTGGLAFIFILCMGYCFELINKINCFLLRTITTILFWFIITYVVNLFFTVYHVEVLYFIAIVPSVIIIGADIYDTIKIRKRDK